ncbi:hypothetical protein ACFVGN_13515 [Streptomyces sp. NPDC057757]|uniref:hypothetical protein n=1 Tax=Streptomyces sp. NPDC057757 TaxID=3346241 RepID=UPI0036C2715D
MNYSELEADILQLVVAADERSARVFGEETVTRLVRPGLLRYAAQDELAEDAWAALTTARENVLTIGAAELGRLLSTVYDGILVEDDLDSGVLTTIQALAHWQGYLEKNLRGELYELAVRSIEEVDHEVSADLDDFLATPPMAAEYARIRRLLSARP